MTFVGALRHDGIIAPWVIDGPINGESFRTYVEQVLVPELRPGDIVGALTGDAGLPKDAIGKIDVFATRSYVAVARKQAQGALEKLRAGKIKGRKFRIHKL